MTQKRLRDLEEQKKWHDYVEREKAQKEQAQRELFNKEKALMD